MEFEWDEVERETNLVKHGFDFLDAAMLFEDRMVFTEARDGMTGEARWAGTGLLDGRFVTVIFTRRGHAVRVISLRRARGNARSRYQALHFS